MRQFVRHKQKLILLISILLSVGFLATSLTSYYVSKSVIRSSIIENELPVTSDNVYSEIQRDLIRPIFISSMMASDTFLRDWVLAGERDVGRMTKYLKEVKDRYQAVTSFFVSERSRIYYHSNGILKKVNEAEQRDVWYFRIQNLTQPYEVNVDIDLANKDAMTIFINYRVYDYQSRFIGVTGVGLTVDAVRKLVNEYEQRYRRSIFFVNRNGLVVFRADRERNSETDIRKIEGLSTLTDRILREGAGSFVYRSGGDTRLLNVRFIPELNWYLFVEKTENQALSGIRKTLMLNLLICLAITAVVLFASTMTINHFQTRLEEMATTDKLTGLYNRQAFDILTGQFLFSQKRTSQPFSLILFDIDLFKQLNDSYGHLAGDRMISEVSRVAKSRLRGADILCRWGGDEFLALVQNCVLSDAVRLAEGIRTGIGETVIQAEGRTIRVSVSVGVAEFRPGEQIDRLLSRADQALYAAKREGKNRTSTGAGP